MKKTILFGFLGLSLLVAAGCVIYVPSEIDRPGSSGDYYDPYYDRTRDFDYSYFYDSLSPHGIWVRHSPYGYVWIPRVDELNWRPYTRGRWVWTDHGWTWFSQRRWGWAVFHYGRWGWTRDLGWFWVPGSEWGPAWVTWRHGLNYIGWAPIPPDVRFIPGIGIGSLPRDPDPRSWIFLENRYFYGGNVYAYVLPYERNRTLVRFTTPRTNIVVRNKIVVNNGLDFDYVRGVTRGSISKHQVVQRNRPDGLRISPSRVEVHSPSINRDENTAPRRVVEKDRIEESLSRPDDPRLRDPESSRSRESRLADRHDREARVVDRTQRQDEEALERQKREELKNSQGQTQRQRVEKQYEEKSSRLKAGHEREKNELKKRQEEEKRKVKKKKIKKRDQPG